MTDNSINLNNLNVNKKQMFFGDLSSKMAQDQQAKSRRDLFVNQYNQRINQKLFTGINTKTPQAIMKNVAVSSHDGRSMISEKYSVNGGPRSHRASIQMSATARSISPSNLQDALKMKGLDGGALNNMFAQKKEAIQSAFSTINKKNESNINDQFLQNINPNGTVTLGSVAQQNKPLQNLGNFNPASYMAKAISDLKQMNDKAFMQTQTNKNGNSSASAQIDQTKDNKDFDIKSVAGKTGFMMFDGFQDNIMKSETAVVEKEANTETPFKTIIKTSNAALGGPDPEKPEGDDENVKDFKVEKTENMAVSMEAVHNIDKESRVKQDKFIAMYEEIRQKVEKNYGQGNGDYEIFDDLYEIVPNRLPVDEATVGFLAKLVDALVVVIDAIYKDKPYQRFYVLETVARVPYFSYISCLHYLETIGYKDNIGWLRIHWAEGWNELHHLLIMEELGGSKNWIDRFLAQHTAVLYYWAVVVLYFIQPSLAYNLSEQIEKHAYETYDGFIKQNSEVLKTLPAPKIAQEYYEAKTFMFDDFQSCRDPGTRRPVIRNLYDVFLNIRNDEAEHFKTMVAAQDELYLKENPTQMTNEQLDDMRKNNSINMVLNPYDMIKSEREAREKAEEDGSAKKIKVQRDGKMIQY